MTRTTCDCGGDIADGPDGAGTCVRCGARYWPNTEPRDAAGGDK